jgi:hypothetical protein
MKLKTKTAIFTLGSIVLLGLAWLIYDIYALSEGGTEASISFMMYSWAYKYPIFTWFMGFIPGLFVGHFFWRIRDTALTKQISDDSRK